jgi:hypothetical protein
MATAVTWPLHPSPGQALLSVGEHGSTAARHRAGGGGKKGQVRCRSGQGHVFQAGRQTGPVAVTACCDVAAWACYKYNANPTGELAIGRVFMLLVGEPIIIFTNQMPPIFYRDAKTGLGLLRGSDNFAWREARWRKEKGMNL